MIRYDSKRKSLLLVQTFQIGDLTPSDVCTSLDLSKLTNQEQQRLIAVAKLVCQFANGHTVTRVSRRKLQDGHAQDESMKGLSEVERAQEVINKTLKIHASDDSKDNAEGKTTVEAKLG